MTIIVIWFAISTILIVGIAAAFVKTIFKLFEVEDELHARDLAFNHLRDLYHGSLARFTVEEILEDLADQYDLFRDQLRK